MTYIVQIGMYKISLNKKVVTNLKDCNAGFLLENVQDNQFHNTLAALAPRGCNASINHNVSPFETGN